MLRRPSTRRPDRRRRSFRTALETCERRQVMSGTGLLPAYDLGTPVAADIWVDPTAGSDARGGGSRGEALRTLSEAWRRVPMGTELTTGVRINLVAGTYGESIVPNYWESRHGTQAAPVIIRAADGAGSARLPNMNVFDCRHLVLDGLDLSAGGGDVLHLERCTNVLVRDTTIRGTGDIAAYAAPQETFKANQCQYVYVEHCDISGATDNAVDFVGVQYGHVVGCRIHRSNDWAMYVKGGSAYLTVTGNEFFAAGTGGFTAGQGTGFEFMVAPWLHYEAYDIVFTNNVIHDTEGAGMGVNGGYNILMAHNTLYRVGARSHAIEVVFGSRTCDGDQATCRGYLAQGGWGTTVVGGDEPIPNRNVFILDNVVLNPDGYASRWQQFAVAGPRTPTTGSNIPAPARADDNLVIRGNVIWNGVADMPLGIESEALAADVLANNSINTVRPLLVDPAGGDYRLAATFAPPPTALIPPFGWSDAPARPAVPAGRSDTAVTFDFTGAARSGPQAAGAFAAAGSAVDPPPPLPSPAPGAVSVQGVALPVAGVRRPGAVLTFQITMTAAVTVTGRPTLPLVIGTAARAAAYAGGSGTAALTFAYTVTRRDQDADGIAVGAAVAVPAAARLSGPGGTTVHLALPTVDASSIRIDTVPPRVAAVVVPAAGTYRAGDVLTFSIRFSESVTVTGTPHASLLVGRTPRRAAYASGSGTDTIVFRYTIMPSDLAPAGIMVGRRLWLPAGGAIRDAAGNAAVLSLAAPSTAGIRVRQATAATLQAPR